MKKIFFAVALFASSMTCLLHAQEPVSSKPASNDENVFTTVKVLPYTSIKDQANSGTCWSYSALAFVESELQRMGKGEYDLSEMFVVNRSYKDKGDKYVRMHGKLNFGQGGSFYDVIYVLKHYGIVPEEAMRGLNYGTTKNMHGEISATAQAYLDAIIKNPNGKLSTAWRKGYDAIIDTYLGEEPEEFSYKGKKYTPKSFAQSLGFNADDYVSLTSYTHHPFYSQFPLEIEDNWRWSSCYNLPINEFMEVMDYAIDKGYSIAWGTDVSEVGFTRDGIGVLADVEAIETKGSDQDRWVGLSRSAKREEIAKLVRQADCPEIEPTQEFRQQGYDNYTLTDDHGMQIVGKAVNQNGRPFFIVKNSWGESGKYNGIWYASRNFVAGRTMNIVLHKDALPKAIAKKLGIK
ncbi:aminopeptidase [Porphyromonas crevioricanis]|uniref:Aminopeptidase n=2 Tax=Porphyromonas crevioricanis TaxID=393921 RepID=A0A0A2FNW6_9PORP|nr:aminopeptidase [Porphyromonas crevioricanis]GAD04672.1 aminopeptidase C [Porphyromonas crevioricanis JCM 15906]GAD07168.1 aminopeptidase C [Porphyromonas crevioricanis JCM 13913]SJZ66634.1 Aminopeptidase C [Porphyromonas crevioricanis]SQH73942.1 Peptidase C1-like family [Porphyromonas crevioricanis]